MWRQLKVTETNFFRISSQLLSIKKKIILPQHALVRTLKDKLYAGWRQDRDKWEGSQYNFKSSYAMLDIFSYLDEHKQAFKILEHHRLRGHPLDIKFYNKLLQLFVSVHEYSEFQNLLFIMNMEGVEPDIQTFAIRLEAYGKMQDSQDDIVEVLEDMKKRGMDPISLFRQVSLLEKQVESIKNALCSVNLEHVANQVSPPYSSLRRVEECDPRVQQQIKNELKGVIYIEPVVGGKHVGSTPKSKLKEDYDAIIEDWKEAFLKHLDKLNDVDSNNTLMDKCLTLVRVIPPEELCDMVFDHIVPQIAAQPRGISISHVTQHLGDLMYKSFCMQFLKKNGGDQKAANVAHDYLNDGEAEANPRIRWTELCKKYHHLEDICPSIWTKSVKILISSTPIHILKATAVIDGVSVLNHGYVKEEKYMKKKEKIKTTGFLTFDSLICRLYKANLDCGGKIAFDADVLPLVTRPRPWSSQTAGGYLLKKTRLLRVSNFVPDSALRDTDPVVDVGEDLADVDDANCDDVDVDDCDGIDVDGCDDNDNDDDDDDDDDDDADVDDTYVDDTDGLGKIYDSMNILGDCRWNINTHLLDVMIEVMQNGGDLELDIFGSTALHEAEQGINKSAKLGIPRWQAKKKYREVYALYIDCLMKLSLANYFVKQKDLSNNNDTVIYNAHNLDFRGRAYSLAPHCSHIGGDVSRSMLVFAKGKKLGQRGLDWLKVHLVNVHGQLKKASFKERIAYADKCLDNIKDSADYPLTGQQWWKGGEDPWQTLMACIEITNALRSEDPENFVSHLPVQMDGSCNGLQHYAALGRDFDGAVQVNVAPSERPQDVYSEVNAFVEASRQKDEDEGDEIARALRGCITRKVVKQTVMTTVYGVTQYGARLQVLRQLEDQGILDPSIQNKAAAYISKQIFKSLEHMLPSARKIQDWLTESARQIASAGKIVEWITPLGLPVKQSYYKGSNAQQKQQVITPFNFKVTIRRMDDFLLPDVRKQQGAFAPNFVHSLDATHMMYTSLRCKEEGIVFASVHDSFWTHACDVDVLHKLCREEFIKLHEQPILDNLKTYFDRRFAGLKMRTKVGEREEVFFDELPERGELDIRQVLDSKYFFS